MCEPCLCKKRDWRQLCIQRLIHACTEPLYALFITAKYPARQAASYAYDSINFGLRETSLVEDDTFKALGYNWVVGLAAG